MRDCSRRPACAARFRRPATMAAPTGAWPRWIPPRGSCTSFRRNIPRSTSSNFPGEGRGGGRRGEEAGRCRAPSAASAADDSFIRYNSPDNFMTQSHGLSAMGPPWSNLTAYDLNTGTINGRFPTAAFSPLEIARPQRHGRAQSPRRTGGHGGRPDFRRHRFRSQSPRLRSRHRQGALGAEICRRAPTEFPQSTKSAAANTSRCAWRRRRP